LYKLQVFIAGVGGRKGAREGREQRKNGGKRQRALHITHLIEPTWGTKEGGSHGCKPNGMAAGSRGIKLTRREGGVGRPPGRRKLYAGMPEEKTFKQSKRCARAGGDLKVT